METLHARRTLCYETQNTDPTLFDGCISFASSVDMYMVPFKRYYWPFKSRTVDMSVEPLNRFFIGGRWLGFGAHKFGYKYQNPRRDTTHTHEYELLRSAGPSAMRS